MKVQNDYRAKQLNFRVLEQHKRLAEELIVDIDHELAGLPQNTKTRLIRDEFFRLFYFINGFDIASFSTIAANDDEEKGTRGKK